MGADAVRSRISGVVLFPGAGSDRTHPSLMALQHALAPIPVSRVDFPYRRQGRRAPDRAPVLIEAVREAVRRAAHRWKVPLAELAIGGRSMGGRMCSMAVADEEDPLQVGALVLISYPLHPPAKPETLRVEHLSRITVPTICISGTRDRFGSPVELRRAMRRVAAPVEWHWVEGKGHDLAGADDEVAAAVVGWIGVNDPSGRRRAPGSRRRG